LTLKGRLLEADLFSHFLQRFTNIKAIKTGVAFKKESDAVSSKLSAFSRISIENVLFISASKNGATLILCFVPLIILYLGGTQVVDGSLTAGTLVAFLQYSNKVHEPIQDIVNLYVDLNKTTISLRRLFGLLNEPVSQEHWPENNCGLVELSNIKLINVSKTIDGNRILDNMTFSMSVGKNYAIVGANGSGKSTLLELLAKLDRPDTGEIFVNDLNLENVKFTDWMNIVSVGHQSPHLFSGTIFDNIAYNNIYVTRETAVDLLNRIDFNVQGHTNDQLLDSEIGEHGSNLSGGQRQKILFVRSLLKKATILLIDEGFSEVDRKSLKRMFDEMFLHDRFKSVVMVTHDFDSLSYFDEIIFVEYGKIVEMGKLDTLISIKTGFYRLFQREIAMKHKRKAQAC